MIQKRGFQLFSIILCCLIFTGCAGQNSQTGQIPHSDTPTGRFQSSNMVSQGKASASLLAATGKSKKTKQKNCRVCLVGNSLIQYGSQAGFLQDIAKGYGRDITVDQLTWGGVYLKDYAKATGSNKKEVKYHLKKADIVVFQDYGGWQNKKTTNAIRKLEKWCRKNAQFYYYMYDYDHYEINDAGYQTLSSLNISLIPKGRMIEKMRLDNFFLDQELRLEGDYHPNSLNGYLSALMMYAVIFDEKCTDFPQKWFPCYRTKLPRTYVILEDSFHGNTKKEKWEEFQKICQTMDEIISETPRL